MAHQKTLKVTPLTDTSIESLNRFVVELNNTFMHISHQLPSVTVKANKVAQRKPVVIPATNVNPVDVASLRTDLESNTLKAMRVELAALKGDIDSLSTTINEIIKSLK